MIVLHRKENIKFKKIDMTKKIHYDFCKIKI